MTTSDKLHLIIELKNTDQNSLKSSFIAYCFTICILVTYILAVIPIFFFPFKGNTIVKPSGMSYPYIRL